MGGENNPGFGYAMPYGHPVTHPGFTTVAWPGHAITTNDIKNMIPKAPVKVKRQIMGGAENFPGMMPMASEQPFPQEQEPEMMGPNGFPDQAGSALVNGPSDGYPSKKLILHYPPLFFSAREVKPNFNRLSILAQRHVSKLRRH